MALIAYCWKFGDNISTDEILSSRYMVLTSPSELAEHVLEEVRPGFAKQLKQGDIIIAGKNFGYGSSREHAPIALKGAGIGAIIAKSFARIFYRNCVNIGLPVIESDAISDFTDEGNIVDIDISSAIANNQTKNQIFQFQAFPPFVVEYLSNGGLINTINNKKKDQTA